ncbi:MAG: mandelate racemase/muconate lactonizing enzyme family protein [Anaerolineae bacterium]
MKVIRVEVVQREEPIPLPSPWRAAWREPAGTPTTAFQLSFYRLTTDEGIVGLGPYSGGDPRLALGVDPFQVGAFWVSHMSGKRAGTSGKGASGLEIALWDIIGKATDQPIYRLLGAQRDRMLVYAATSRTMELEAHVQQVQELQAQGFKAVKLRLHRPNPWDDLAAVAAVREAVGSDLVLLVDANQNNASQGYNFWSRQTALKMARELEALDVYLLEEPLPRTDIEGLADIAASVDMFIAGGEHTPTLYDWREHVIAGAYDILQPDLVMGGNIGITGVRKVADLAEAFGRLVIPHVLLAQGNFPLCLAPSLHAMAAVENCPMVEFPYDPPILTAETTQAFVKEPFDIDEDGCVPLPEGPGLGVEIDEEKLGEVNIVERASV